MQAIILAGGQGNRLWPASTQDMPKPFLKINSSFSLLQNTYLRTKGLSSISGITTIASKGFIQKISDEYLEAGGLNINFVKNSFISEPISRNTAPAIAVSVSQIYKLYGEDEVILVLPSDHIIEDEKEFKNSVGKAIKQANRNKIVLFGMAPDSTDVNYGYIKHTDDEVLDFIEKPSKKDASTFIKEGGYLWNSGMFCFKAGVFLKEMQKNAPDIMLKVQHCIDSSKYSNKNDYIELELDLDSFASIKKSSIDYELIEKSKNLAVIPANFGWRDVGNWDSLSKLYEDDDKGNKVNGVAYLKDTHNCYVENSGKNISVIGVSNLAIINSDQGILVTDKSRVSEVCNVFSKAASHKEKQPPWGKIKEFSHNSEPNITEITITPKVHFKIDDYFKKSANWLVVSGIAEFSSNDSVVIISENESKYISADTGFHITNIGTTPLIIFSIQIDDYMLKNNIVRRKDNFKKLDNEKITMF